MPATHHDRTRGASAPLGATVSADGVNFSVFSRHATAVEIVFFERVEDARPARVVRLDPVANRTDHYWHGVVPGVRPGQLYGYRVAGPYEPARGLRFDATKVLLDPYGRGVAVPPGYSAGNRPLRRDQLRRPDLRRGPRDDGRPRRQRHGRHHRALRSR